jgi:sulfoxide reductase heme-binding subunit YedZ
MVDTSLSDHGWWLLSRTAGIVALLAISASVSLGLWSSLRAKRRPGLAAATRGLHEHLALVGLVAVAVHGIALLGDPWLRPGIDGITIPFADDHRPVWVASGIVGGYLAAILGLSFYIRKRLGAKRWRSAHRFATLAYVLAVVHTVGAGTDAGTPWLQTLLVLTVAPNVALLLLRVTQPPTPSPPARPRAAAPPPAPAAAR